MERYSSEKHELQSFIEAKKSRLADLERMKRNGDAPEDLLNEGITNERREIESLQNRLDNFTE